MMTMVMMLMMLIMTMMTMMVMMPVSRVMVLLVSRKLPPRLPGTGRCAAQSIDATDADVGNQCFKFNLEEAPRSVAL